MVVVSMLSDNEFNCTTSLVDFSYLLWFPDVELIEDGRLSFEISSPHPDRWPQQPFLDSDVLVSISSATSATLTEMIGSKPILSIISLSYYGNGTLEPFQLVNTRWYYAFRYRCTLVLPQRRFPEGTQFGKLMNLSPRF
jgi:hypothetical protein